MRGLGALLVLLLAAPAARAGDESIRLENGVEVRVWSPWPPGLYRGWAPIFVELSNSSDEERTVHLEADSNDYGQLERHLETRLELQPGERASTELLVPLGAAYNNDYSVRVHAGDESHWFGGILGASSGGGHDVHPVLFLSPDTPAAGEVERWTAELSDKIVESFGGAVSISGRYSLTLSGTPSSGATPANNNIQLAHSTFDGLARHHAAYSCLDLVVIDTDRGLPSAERLAPLLSWVRAGGDLLLIGKRARSEAAGAPALAAWMEPRFETERRRYSEFRCGLGRLFVGEFAADVGGPYRDCVRDVVSDKAALVPNDGQWRGAGLQPRIPNLSRLPYRTFALLLFLFALVIGPVNFVVAWRKKRPVMVLVTIPAIALVTTVVLLAYGIFFQGLDVKTASYSVAVLDQREHRSACVESRQLFAGVAPAAGLALGPGTIVHYQPFSDRRGFSRSRFTIELDGGYLLSGDYLPSRRAVQQVLAVERAERARLDVRLTAAGLEVANNLGVQVMALIVRDLEGRAFVLPGPLAAGGSAKLPEARDPQAVEAAVHQVRSCSLPPRAGASASLDDDLPKGCYLAELASSPFRDDCGIETNELAGAHVVLGVLSATGEDWR